MIKVVHIIMITFLVELACLTVSFGAVFIVGTIIHICVPHGAKEYVMSSDVIWTCVAFNVIPLFCTPVYLLQSMK